MIIITTPIEKDVANLIPFLENPAYSLSSSVDFREVISELSHLHPLASICSELLSIEMMIPAFLTPPSLTSCLVRSMCLIKNC